MVRGYCGIGALNMKTDLNYGTLFRSAQAFNADFIFLIGRRFKKMASDTTAAHKHVPLYEYTDVDDFLAHVPYDCQKIGIEIVEEAQDIRGMKHPERAVYILGPEDGSLPQKLLGRCQFIIKIPTSYCLNIAVAGSIVLYDRLLKQPNPSQVKERE